MTNRRKEMLPDNNRNYEDYFYPDDYDDVADSFKGKAVWWVAFVIWIAAVVGLIWALIELL